MTIPKYYIYILCIYRIYIVTDASPLIQEPHAAPTQHTRPTRPIQVNDDSAATSDDDDLQNVDEV
jgi:hypothetical protein